jgi:hypothetical protein
LVRKKLGNLDKPSCHESNDESDDESDDESNDESNDESDDESDDESNDESDDESDDESGLTGLLGILAQGLQGNKLSLTHLNLSRCKLLDKDIDDLGQILATCKLEELDLRGNRITLLDNNDSDDLGTLGQILATCKLQRLDLSDNEITHSGFVSLTQTIPKSLKRFYFSGNDFDEEEVACHILTLFEEHPQLWDDGLYWNDSRSPMHKKIQHFKDLNQCGRILLAHAGGTIPLSVWPIVLARAYTVMRGSPWSHKKEERTHNAIFHLLQGPALMQRRFDRESSQAPDVSFLQLLP